MYSVPTASPARRCTSSVSLGVERHCMSRTRFLTKSKLSCASSRAFCFHGDAVAAVFGLGLQHVAQDGALVLRPRQERLARHLVVGPQKRHHVVHAVLGVVLKHPRAEVTPARVHHALRVQVARVPLRLLRGEVRARVERERLRAIRVGAPQTLARLTGRAHVELLRDAHRLVRVIRSAGRGRGGRVVILAVVRLLAVSPLLPRSALFLFRGPPLPAPAPRTAASRLPRTTAPRTRRASPRPPPWCTRPRSPAA